MSQGSASKSTSDWICWGKIGQSLEMLGSELFSLEIHQLPCSDQAFIDTLTELVRHVANDTLKVKYLVV
jgi:hypothetical protein